MTIQALLRWVESTVPEHVRRLHARQHHGPLSHRAITLAATGQIRLAVVIAGRWRSRASGDGSPGCPRRTTGAASENKAGSQYDDGMSPATALLLHGFTSGPASMWRFGEWLAGLGYQGEARGQLGHGGPAAGVARAARPRRPGLATHHNGRGRRGEAGGARRLGPGRRRDPRRVLGV